MLRIKQAIGLIAVLTFSACGPAGSPPVVLPTFLPQQALVTPEINAAYPTLGASESNTSQTVRGFSVTVQRAWRDGKQVVTDVCFVLPDVSDWTIWNAHFDYDRQVISEFSSSMLSKQEAANGQPGQRCDELSFYVPPDANLSSASFTVESLGAYPSQDEYCSRYMPKIQQSLNDRGIGITLICAQVNGAMTMQIANKPGDMSEQDAEKLVFSDDFYTVKGPWTFPVTFGQ